MSDLSEQNPHNHERRRRVTEAGSPLGGLILAVILVIFTVLVLVSCSNGTPPSEQVGNTEQVHDKQWYELTDPETDITFRCHWTKHGTSHGYNVFTEWCYQPYPAGKP